MCVLHVTQNNNLDNDTVITPVVPQSSDEEPIEEDAQQDQDASDNWDNQRDEWEEERQDVQDIRSGDVTSPSPIIPPQAVLIEEEEQQDEVIEESFLPPEPESELISEDNESSQVPQDEWWESSWTLRNICQNPLVWPLSLWGNNDREEVEALERFLMGRWLLAGSNWVFWDDVFEAVRQFQEEFRAEILTPWGINNPTWYVGRTTIQKIQELTCN